MLNTDTLNKLFQMYKDDSMVLNLINNSILAFEEYHCAIYKSECFIRYKEGSIEGDEYREKAAALDSERTRKHNSVLSGIKILNRLAAQQNLPPLYDGIVSEEKPYRREVADSVLQFVEDIIKERE